MNNSKKTIKIYLIMILLGLIFFLLLIYLIRGFIPHKSDKLEKTYQLTKNDQLIGQTIEYCDSVFGPAKKNSNKEGGKKIYNAGCKSSIIFGLSETWWYELVVWYDKNGIITKYEIRYAPWV